MEDLSVKTQAKSVAEPALEKKDDEMILYEKLLVAEKMAPDQEAIRMDGESFTFTDAVEEIDIIAAAFEECNVTEKTVVVLCLPDNPQKLFCVYALNKIGAVSALVEPGVDPDDLRENMSRLGSECLVMMDTMIPSYQDMLTESDPGMVVVCSRSDFFSMPKRRVTNFFSKTDTPECPKDAFYTTYRQMARFGKDILDGKINDTYDWPSAFEEVKPEPEKAPYVPKSKPEDIAVYICPGEAEEKIREVKSSDLTSLPLFLKAWLPDAPGDEEDPEVTSKDDE